MAPLNKGQIKQKDGILVSWIVRREL